MTRLMYDAIDPLKVPADGDLFAGYIDGRWQSYFGLVKRFPTKRVIKIAVFPSTSGGEVYDVETGDLVPGDVPAVLRRERAAGHNPTMYCNLSNKAEIIAAVAAAGLAQPPLWIAHYTGVAHMEPGAVATQWGNPGPYDVSLVADHWPGIDAGGTYVPPSMNPPVHLGSPIVDWHLTAPFPAGAWLLCLDGSVYALGSAVFHGGCNGQPWFAGRQASAFGALTPAELAAGKAYVVIASDGARYALPA